MTNLGAIWGDLDNEDRIIICNFIFFASNSLLIIDDQSKLFKYRYIQQNDPVLMFLDINEILKVLTYSEGKSSDYLKKLDKFDSKERVLRIIKLIEQAIE